MTLAAINPPAEALTRLIDRHGVRETLTALFAVLATRAGIRRAARLNAAQLTDHLRRDIGLPPHPPASGRWDIR